MGGKIEKKRLKICLIKRGQPRDFRSGLMEKRTKIWKIMHLHCIIEKVFAGGLPPDKVGAGAGAGSYRKGLIG